MPGNHKTLEEQSKDQHPEHFPLENDPREQRQESKSSKNVAQLSGLLENVPVESELPEEQMVLPELPEVVLEEPAEERESVGEGQLSAEPQNFQLPWEGCRIRLSALGTPLCRVAQGAADIAVEATTTAEG